MRTYLNNDELEVVKIVVEHNAHMDHPENILLCAIKYEYRDYRKFALQKILLLRKDTQVNQPILVRNFHPPLINFKAENYLNLTNH